MSTSDEWPDMNVRLGTGRGRVSKGHAIGAEEGKNKFDGKNRFVIPCDYPAQTQKGKSTRRSCQSCLTITYLPCSICKQVAQTTWTAMGGLPIAHRAGALVEGCCVGHG
jgi:hypothetical protein